jgi:hypothetical protein
LKELSDRNDVIRTMHRALATHSLDEERGVDQYVRHGTRPSERVTGRVLAKGLAGDEMDERVYLVVDGIDGRVHHMEFPDASPLKDIGREMIVEVAPAILGTRAVDRNIALNAGEKDQIYRPSQHLGRIREQFEREGRIPNPSSARMSEGWRLCVGQGMSNASVKINGRFSATSSSAARPTIAQRW